MKTHVDREAKGQCMNPECGTMIYAGENMLQKVTPEGWLVACSSECAHVVQSLVSAGH
jgi:hypothetical protein